MRVHLPKQETSKRGFPHKNLGRDGKYVEYDPLQGEYRDLTCFGEDLWQLKITVPEVSIIDNLYLGFTDEEIDVLEQQIKEEKERRKKLGH